jgi:Diguanylate cyclase, GGDEF domain
MIDADHLKTYNDHYGHAQGDRCLRAIAEVINGAMYRPGDLAARYGGEEFTVVLPGVDLRKALEIGNRIRTAVAALGLPHGANPHGHVTISIGAAWVVPTRFSAPPTCSPRPTRLSTQPSAKAATEWLPHRPWPAATCSRCQLGGQRTHSIGCCVSNGRGNVMGASCPASVGLISRPPQQLPAPLWRQASKVGLDRKKAARNSDDAMRLLPEVELVQAV